MNTHMKLVILDRDGTINAIDIYCLSDTGAYGEHAPTVFWVVGQKTLPLYGKAKACRYHGHALYTNKTPGGALRGYGATQGTFALESAINELAAKLGMDPTALRTKNLLAEGETHPELCGSTPGNPATLASSSLHRNAAPAAGPDGRGPPPAPRRFPVLPAFRAARP